MKPLGVKEYRLLSYEETEKERNLYCPRYDVCLGEVVRLGWKGWRCGEGCEMREIQELKIVMVSDRENVQNGEYIHDTTAKRGTEKEQVLIELFLGFKSKKDRSGHVLAKFSNVDFKKIIY